MRFKDAYQIGDNITSPTLQFTHFNALSLALPRFKQGTIVEHPNDVDFKPFNQLLKQWNDPLHRTELYWRLSYLVSAVLMALLAVFMVPYKPRSGKLGYIGIALLVFILYASILTTLKNAAVEGQVNPELAFLGLYALLSSVLIVLWRRQPV